MVRKVPGQFRSMVPRPSFTLLIPRGKEKKKWQIMRHDYSVKCTFYNEGSLFAAGGVIRTAQLTADDRK